MAEDTEVVGVQSVILIEDSVQFYSSFLPLIYTEIIKQQQHLISEGVSITDRFLRMRARPKILLCVNYEQAWDYFTRYEGTLLGVISDIGFSREGAYDPRAGIRFAELLRIEPRMLSSVSCSASGNSAWRSLMIPASTPLIRRIWLKTNRTRKANGKIASIRL